MVRFILQKTKHIHPNIDWNALDESWADQYEDDYGCRFSNLHFNSIKRYIHAPQLEEGMAGSV